MPNSSGRGVGLELRCVSHAYGKSVVLDRLSLSCEPGQFVAVVGPSGGGKTTLLNVVAGFVEPQEGHVLFDGMDVTGVPVHKRNLGVVFQSYALFPNMSALENVMFPLVERKVVRGERESRAMKALELVGLAERAAYRPGQLSGGQQQRVGLARAIVHRPGLLLMDEPMGALEPSLRVTLQEEIRRIHREFGVTVIYVTHDPQEALELADLVAVVDKGRVGQIGLPAEVWTRPTTRFVARALGECNVIPGRLEGLRTFVPDGGSVPYDVRPRPDLSGGSSAWLLVRPERMRLQACDETEAAEIGGNGFVGTVERVDFGGNTRRVHVVRGEGLETVVVTQLGAEGFGREVGGRVMVRWKAEDCWVVGE
ncbi:MAG: ABC transporter ATP-binding protein [Candidatus Dormibacteria bacterium]